MDITNEESAEIPIGFRAHERQLAVPEEVVVYLNELNAANMIVNAKLEEYAKEPIMRFIDGKFAIVDGDKETVLFTSDDWYLIGEFRINGFDSDQAPNDIEFIWGWGLRPEDPRTKPITKAVEELPYGLQPLTFPLVKFEDIGLVEIIKAYVFHSMELEYTITKWSDALQSWGIFGVKNITWAELQKPKSPEWEKILSTVRNLVEAKKIADPTIDRKVAVEAAWKDPEVLALVAEYRRTKDAAYQQKMEITERIRQALINPAAIVTQMMQQEAQTTEAPANQTDPQKELNAAMQSVERAFMKVEEAELAKLDSVGGDDDDE